MFKKTIAVLTIAVFLSSSVSFALEDFYSLRARAAAERDQGSVRVPTSDPAAAGVMNRLGTSELPGVFIGSHPDDIEEATTGLQLNLLGSGRNNIYWGVIADGETGVWDNQVEGYQSLPPAEIKKRKVAMREAESKKAAQVMGLPDGRVKFFRFGTGDERPQPPDNKAHKFSETIGPREREFIDHLKDISKRYPAGTPIAVAWNTDEDNHTCHAYCAKFVKAAVDKFVQETGRPVCIVRFKQLQGVAAAERPNAYVLIDQAASDKKDDVLRCHDSQEQRQASQGRTTMVAECRKQESEIKLKGAQTAFPAEKLDEYVRAERFQISELKPVFSKGICRILVVDNSEDDAKITARAIKRWRPDAVVEMATDLNEALDKYMSAARGGEPFEAVVSDVDISASGSARTGFEL
ncbi:MAG: PIG-L family deacetylase, partial [Candidatus Omnitrophica bacterium]|nr:PIG-L family deacetylase [Candidatus Omnitrophota bacterium]